MNNNVLDINIINLEFKNIICEVLHCFGKHKSKPCSTL